MPDHWLPIGLGLLWWTPALYMLARFRYPRRLPTAPAATDDLPSVSIIIPARNEERTLPVLLESLAALEYPDFEIIVVDDRSDDRTAAVARAWPPGRSRGLTVVEGEPLPEGWFGKPWACTQGARLATGELLLFTDADTRHAPDLLARAVLGLREDRADLMSLLGLQIMGSFWERVVQPHVFALLSFQFPDFRRVYGDTLHDPARFQKAIANGQFMLFEREAYERLGGHERVMGEVVEDLCIAQELVKDGGRLGMREAIDSFGTRMYTSLPEIINGWSKNIATASRQVRSGVLGRLMLPTAALLISIAWIVPPAVLLATFVGFGGGALHLWAAVAVVGGLGFWVGALFASRVTPVYALTYPLGAAVTTYILMRSLARGDRVEWKGRHYTG